MLKTINQAWRQPGTNTIKAIVEYFINYEIVNDKVVKKSVSFYVCGSGEFTWCDMLRDWDLNLSNKYPTYKPSEAARMVNKYTGLSITYKDIRRMIDNTIENLQNRHNHKVFLQKQELIEKDIETIMTDAIQKIVRKHNLTFNQYEDELEGYEENFDITTYSFVGESNGNNFAVKLDSVLEKVYETLKNSK